MAADSVRYTRGRAHDKRTAVADSLERVYDRKSFPATADPLWGSGRKKGVSKYRIPLLLLLACGLSLAVAVGVEWLLADEVPERIGVPRGGRLEKSEAEWRDLLTPEQFRVTRQKGTERAFSGAYWDTKDDGVYCCACCDQPLFDSRAKFDSGTGWPSYWKP